MLPVGQGGVGLDDTFLYPALLVVLFWLAFLNVSLFFVGSPHMSQLVAQ